jgi:hypothetical protein
MIAAWPISAAGRSEAAKQRDAQSPDLPAFSLNSSLNCCLTPYSIVCMSQDTMPVLASKALIFGYQTP